jgi:16S rRNA processing protein RimM
MSGEEPRFLVVGTIQKPHGIKGELFVRLETDRPDAAFAEGRVLRLGGASGEVTEETLTVERARAFKGGMLVRAAGISGRDEGADALRGRTLWIPREEADAPAEDEVFYHQLLGMRVSTAAEGEVGTVVEVYDAPSGPLLSVRRTGRPELLIPFVREMIRRLDPAAKELELDLPAGLLEL